MHNPFHDGNGRISRLLTLLLLCQHGYMAGKYISMESLIEKTKENYYSTLKQSSDDWQEEKNDIWPFIRYMLGVLLAAYREFEARVVIVSDEKIGLFTKADIVQSCPDIAVTTIEKVLGEMKHEGIVKTVGSGRATKWCKTKE